MTMEQGPREDTAADLLWPGLAVGGVWSRLCPFLLAKAGICNSLKQTHQS